MSKLKKEINTILDEILEEGTTWRKPKSTHEQIIKMFKTELYNSVLDYLLNTMKFNLVDYDIDHIANVMEKNAEKIIEMYCSDLKSLMTGKDKEEFGHQIMNALKLYTKK